jgi:hypothetical protein
MVGGGNGQGQTPQQGQPQQQQGGGGNPLSGIPIIGNLLGGLGGGGQSQQQSAPQQGQSPSQGPTGAAMMGTAPHPPGAMQRMGPDGIMHWYDMNGNIVG